ncbi:hypothetical protein C1646_716505 [Rhizophagus diaphanus]|nr:hypothetical protein C1646_716505 [Rhizophagus diaphanus] [Rhizophagus sp. MUCL 43196]
MCGNIKLFQRKNNSTVDVICLFYLYLLAPSFIIIIIQDYKIGNVRNEKQYI